MNHNNRAFVKDLLVWFNNKHEKSYTDIIFAQVSSMSTSYSIPGMLIMSRGYIEYQSRWDLELKVILVKHAYH